MAILKTQLLLRNDTLANWTTAGTTVLGKGEVGIAWDGETPRIKIGDGTSTWAELNFYGGSFEITGSGNCIVNASYDEAQGKLTLEKGNRVVGSSLNTEEIILGAGDYGVKSSGQKITETLGSDHSTVPTSLAVKTALENAIGAVDTGVTSIQIGDDNVVNIDKADSAETGAVVYELSHAKKGPTSGYTSGNSNTTIGAIGGSFKIPQITVDAYGHVNSAADEEITITMPTIPEESALSVGSEGSGNVVTSITNDGHAITYTKGLSVYSKSEVDSKIGELTNAAVVLKGTLGTGGTITELPEASISVLGDAYKVITAGTYASIAAKVGDMFICYQKNATPTYEWMLIPSGDDIEDTWRAIKVGGTELKGIGTSTGAINFIGNQGISIAGSGDNITVGHTNKITAGSAAEGGATRTLSYGDEFNIPSVSYDANGHITSSSNITLTLPSQPPTYDLPIMSKTTLGGAYLFSNTKQTVNPTTVYTTTGRSYAVQLNADNQLVVNVPWTDNNTTYGNVTTSAAGLAPIASANKFLVTKNGATSASWESVLTIDGGSATSTDWGKIS